MRAALAGGAVTMLLQALHAWCGPAGPLAGGGVLVGLFLAGAAGSTLHCVPMCGGFVLGQVADRMAALPAGRLCEWRRVSAGALLPYHAGRLTTYAGLGAGAGLAGGLLSNARWFGLLSALLLTGAATVFLLHALRRALPGLGRVLPRLDAAPAGWNRFLARLVRRVGAGHGPGFGAGPERGSGSGRGDGPERGYRPARGYGLGLALGFLPCGFLYAALAVTAANASAALGALGMLAFGLGTAPALMAVGIAGQAAGARWRRGTAAAAPALMGLNAALLLALAWQRLALLGA